MEVKHKTSDLKPIVVLTGNAGEHWSMPASQDASKDRPRLITVNEAALRVGCSPRHWLRLVNDGLAPVGVKLGALRRWNALELDAWINAGCPAIKSNVEQN